MKVQSNCDDCVFAKMEDKQTGCFLDRDIKLGVEETKENGFFALSRFCNTYRPKDWMPLLSLEESSDLKKTVMEEVRPRVGFFVIMDTSDEESISRLKSTLLDIKNQDKGTPRYVVVINNKVEYNEGVQALLTELFDHDETLHHIVQINTEFHTKHHLIDEAFIHAKNGWIYITSTGEKVPSDLLEKIHQRINIDMKILSVVKPYDDINGMIFQASLFKLFNGNRRKVHADKDHTIDDRSFLDKIQSAEGSEGSILEWEEFYGN